MSKPTLYMFIGYPGAGKTTVAKMIAEKTGAVHLWADVERHKMFPKPTHTTEESRQLYDALNRAVEYLLSNKRSVIYDTNFNFLADRTKLRKIAKDHKAEPVIIWVATPLLTAKERAVSGQEVRNGYEVLMTPAEFDAIAVKMQKPSDHEKVIKLDGTKIDPTELYDLLSI